MKCLYCASRRAYERGLCWLCYQRWLTLAFPDPDFEALPLEPLFTVEDWISDLHMDESEVR